MRAVTTALLIGLFWTMIGCALPIQPGFPISEPQAQAARKAMQESPKPLDRPLVVMGGYRAPYHVQVRVFAGRITRMTSGVRADILGISFFYNNSIEAAADRAVEKIEEQWPSDDPEWTTEVDAIGISMGGLVARQAWASDLREDGSPRKRLRLARLYTIATPHQGAAITDSIAPGRLARQMRAGSDILQSLAAADTDRDFELVCYARTNDEIVGASRTSPKGDIPYWVHGPLLFSHMTVARDWRFAVDIARRLRGETPFALEASEPPSE